MRANTYVIGPLGAIVTIAPVLLCGGCPAKPVPHSVSDSLVDRLRNEGRAGPEEPATSVVARLVPSNAALLRSISPGVDDLGRRSADLSRRLAKRKDAKYLLPPEAEELRLLAFDYLKQTKLLNRVA